MIDQWLTFMLHRSFDFSLAFAVGFIIWKIREQRIPPQWACWLFAALLLKLMLPGFVSSPMPGVGHLSYTPAAVEQPAAPVRVAVVAAPKPDNKAKVPSVKSGTLLVDTSKRTSGWSLPTWPQSVFFVWLAVVLALAWRELQAHRRLLMLIRNARPFNAAPLGINLHQLQRQAGVVLPVRWLTADWAKAPMAYGFLRPVIITPAHWGDECRPDQARWVLMHELAHIRRGDYAVFVIQRLLQIVYFFHPLVWWCNNLIHHLREYSCDEMAAAASDASPRDCGEGLLRIAALSSDLPYKTQTALGAADSERILRRRLMRILRTNTNKQSSYSWKSVVGLCLIVVSLIALRSEPVNGQASVNAPNGAATVSTDFQRETTALKQLQKEVEKKLSGELGKHESVLFQRNVKVSNLVVAQLETEDGDIMIASTPDPKAIEASFVVTLNVHKRNNTPVSEEELENVKKFVGVKSVEGDQWNLKASISKDLPKEFNISLNVYALVPERMRLTASSGDGDLRIEGMSVVEAETSDGDVSVFACSKKIDVKSGDGDIHVTDSQGPVTVRTEDGDISIEQVAQCELLQTGDGDIRIKNVKRCESIVTGDGDVNLDSLGQFTTIHTGDGDVRVNVIESPEQDGSIESGDGTIKIRVKDDVKVSIELNQSTSGKRVHVEGMDNTQVSGDTQTVMKNGGGKTIKVEVEEGDIELSSFE